MNGQGAVMLARDVMKMPVISVKPEATVREAAAILAANGISGAPVIDEAGLLLGMISEGDLLHRVEMGTESERGDATPDGPWTNRDAEHYIKSYGRLAADVMTEEVVAVLDTAPLRDVANLLGRHNIRRVPVMHAGRIVGIVSRGDLVRALADTPLSPAEEKNADDKAIREQLITDLRGRNWAFDDADVAVIGGTVHLTNRQARPHSEIHAMIIAAERVSGVRAVEVHDETRHADPLGTHRGS